MGLLDSFERGLERAVNGAFAKTFRSGVQPVEIASALRSEMDKRAAVVSRDRILTPNTFTVRLAPSDAERMAQLGSALDGELVELVTAHAKKQRFSLSGPVSITLVSDSGLTKGTVRVESSAAADTVVWQGVAVIDGKQHPLKKGRTVIGRGSDADITIPDSGTSRRHVEILWDGERAMVRDLGSTNGTTLSGQRISEAPLQPDAVVRIGRTDITFRVVARPARGGEPATVLYDVERDA